MRIGLTLWGVLAANIALSQTDANSLGRLLDAPLQTSDVASYQVRDYLLHKVPNLPNPSTAEQWTVEANEIRAKFLKNVVFHGWPEEWVNAPLKVEDLGLIPSGPGYRMRKLRYEIVPGFYSVGILYEPEN